MKLFSFLLVILSACSAPKQFTKPRTVEMNNKPGIKSIIEKSYKADVQNNVVVIGARSRKYDFDLDFVQHYDAGGILTKEIRLKQTDSIDSELEYHYSPGKDTVKILRKKYSDSSFHLYETKYIDSNGVISINYFHDWQYYYESTAEGSKKRYSNNYQLNKTGINSRFQFDPDSKGNYELIHFCVSIFDNNNNIIKELVFNPGRTLWSIRKRKYNSYKTEVYSKLFFPKKHNQHRDRNEKIVYTYSYEYDLNLNWVKKIEYVNSRPTYVVMRQIEYY